MREGSKKFIEEMKKQTYQRNKSKSSAYLYGVPRIDFVGLSSSF